MSGKMHKNNELLPGTEKLNINDDDATNLKDINDLLSVLTNGTSSIIDHQLLAQCLRKIDNRWELKYTITSS